MKSSFALLDFYKRPFVVVSKSRYCRLTYSAVRSNFIYIYSHIIILFLVSYLLFVFSVIYLANKSIYILALAVRTQHHSDTAPEDRVTGRVGRCSATGGTDIPGR